MPSRYYSAYVVATIIVIGIGMGVAEASAIPAQWAYVGGFVASIPMDVLCKWLQRREEQRESNRQLIDQYAPEGSDGE